MTIEEHTPTDEPGATADNSVEIEIVTPTAEALGIELPEDPSAAVTMLLGALANARSEAGQNLEQLQRVAAEYENFRRRSERDRLEVTTYAAARIVERLLPALDSFEAALAYEPQTESEQKLLAGMTGTYAMLADALADHGFAAIEATGTAFDPALHEAISAPTDGEGTLVVDQELRRGYTVDGRVVRPALVTVTYGDVGEGTGGDDDA